MTSQSDMQKQRENSQDAEKLGWSSASIRRLCNKRKKESWQEKRLQKGWLDQATA